MRRFRSLVTRTPVLIISMLAVALSLGGAAYASTQGGGSGPGANIPSHLPIFSHVHHPAGSRAAISTGVTFRSLSLANGWQSENANRGTGNPKAGILNGVVYLKGSLSQPSPGSSIFAVLPSSERPTDILLINVYTEFGTLGTLEILPDGRMIAFSSASCGSGDTAQCFTSLAGISFPVNS
jgi:hypothetical protein